jgi:hypothetical protein
MVNLNGHEAGNGGYSQGTPPARCAFLYSEAAGEYVSVHSQADSEQAELELESAELKQTTRASTPN